MKTVSRNMIFTAALFLSFSLSGCSSKASEERLRGIELLEQGKYQEAEDMLNQALADAHGRIGRETLDILLYRAEAEYMIGDLDQSRETINILIQADGEKDTYTRFLAQLDAHLLIADASRALNEDSLEEARSDLDKANAAGLANDRDYQFDEAVYLEKTAKWEEACQAFTDYCTRYPDDKAAARELSFLKSRVNELEKNDLLKEETGS